MAAGSSTVPNLAPISTPAGSASQVSAIGPENPQTQTPGQQYFSTGNVSEEDKKKLVQTVTQYREQWGTDRLDRFRIWMKNVLMYKGTQVLQWDYNQNMWFDALSWYRQNKQEDGEEVNLERWINNITLMLGTAWVGNMSRGVPQTVVRPENANVLADVTTARAASEAIGIIERRNQGRQMVRGEFEMLYLFGCYFKYTRGVLDGNWSGYDEEPIFGMKAVAVPARKKCYGCAKETPADQLDPGNVQPCPKCGMGMGPETYHPAENRQSLTVVGTQKVPRAMVRQTIHSPLEIDADPAAKSLEQTPLLVFDQEIDIGEARMMLPAMREKLQEGAPAATSQNAEYERLRRAELTSITSGFTADTVQQRPTYSQAWMKPIGFYRTGDYDFGDRMVQAFPEGLRLTMVGEETVDIRKAVLVKQWSHCRLHEGFGIYCPSIAERVVPFNERFNSTMQILDDWAQRAACGMNVVDGSRIDTEKWKGRSLAPSTLLELPMKMDGQRQPLSESFAHFDLPLNPALWSYPQMLWNFCQLIAGIPPQAFGGGTQPGVETLGGQQQMLSQANTAMAPFWENVKEEHALAAQNAIECLQQLMQCGAVREIMDVIDAMGSAYRNNYVNWNMMQGRVKVYPDEDQGLPQSADDLRTTFTMVFQEMTKGNEAAKAVFDVPVNQEMILRTLLPDLTPPLEAQRSKTLQDINTLLEQDWVPMMNPDGSYGQQLPVMPEKNVEKFPTAIETMRGFRLENFMLRVQNPRGWQRLDAYAEMLENLNEQVAAEQAQRQQKVTQAGAPPQPPPPSAQEQQALQMILQDGAQAVQRLDQIGNLPPLPKGSSLASQVAALKEIVDAALKAQQANGG